MRCRVDVLTRVASPNDESALDVRLARRVIGFKPWVRADRRRCFVCLHRIGNHCDLAILFHDCVLDRINAFAATLSNGSADVFVSKTGLSEMFFDHFTVADEQDGAAAHQSPEPFMTTRKCGNAAIGGHQRRRAHDTRPKADVAVNHSCFNRAPHDHDHNQIDDL